MQRKLRILFIFNTWEASKLLIHNIHMHNLHTIFVKIIDICRHFSNDLVNKTENIMIAVSSLTKDISVNKFDRILFETANIKLECPYRPNLKDRKLLFVTFAKARKLIETIFSQSGDQFMLIRITQKKPRDCSSG